MKVYPTVADGLRDAMRLAKGMTHKWAGLGIGFGGGKAVLAVPQLLEGARRERLLRRYGALVESLGGAFVTGPDLGMGPEQMATVAQTTRHVLGIDYRTMTSYDPGPFTARGVYCGLRAALKQALASDELDGRAVLVEGVGGVGDPLARALARDGCQGAGERPRHRESTPPGGADARHLRRLARARTLVRVQKS